MEFFDTKDWPIQHREIVYHAKANDRQQIYHGFLAEMDLRKNLEARLVVMHPKWPTGQYVVPHFSTYGTGDKQWVFKNPPPCIKEMWAIQKEIEKAEAKKKLEEMAKEEDEEKAKKNQEQDKGDEVNFGDDATKPKARVAANRAARL